VIRFLLIPKRKPYSRLRLLGLLLIASLLIATVYVWHWYVSSIKLTSEDRFNQIIDKSSRTLTNQFEVYANMLYSGRGLFLVNNTMNQQKWDTFIKAQNITQRYPAISGIHYASVVNRNNLDNFLSDLVSQSESSQPINLRPSSNKQQLVILTYYSSDTDKHAIVGFDMYADSMRAQALDKARDNNAAQSSVPVVLASDLLSGRKSVVVVLPVYNPSAPELNSVSSRRANIQGFVAMGLHIQQFLDDVYAQGGTPSSIHVAVAIDGAPVYSFGQQSTGQQLQKRVVLDLAGKTWQFTYTSPRLIDISVAGISAPYVVLTSGLLLSLLLGITIYYATLPDRKLQ